MSRRILFFYPFRVPTQSKDAEQNKNELDFLVVIDFEATCEEKNYPDYPHEIIEFPAVIIDTNTMQVISNAVIMLNPTVLWKRKKSDSRVNLRLWIRITPMSAQSRNPRSLSFVKL